MPILKQRSTHCRALLALVLSGCGAPWQEPTGALLGASAAAIPVFHRDLFDVAYSALTGRDCSVVRLDRDESYCRPVEGLPAIPPYCTASLGVTDCWAVPYAPGPASPLLLPPGFPAPVAAGPFALTPAQEEDRIRAWPPL